MKAVKKTVKRKKKVISGYPYKVGDIVRLTKEQDGWIGTGRIRTLEDGYPSNIMKLEDDGSDDGTWYIGDEVRKSVVLLERGGKKVSGGRIGRVAKPVAPELGMKFALKYDLSSDPVELFATKVEVRARIAELVKSRRDLKQDSIWVFRVSAPKHVTVSTAISTF